VPKRRVFVTEIRVNHSNCIKIDIGARGQILELLRGLLRLSPSGRDGINPTKWIVQMFGWFREDAALASR
jgi:hypothetical protein